MHFFYKIKALVPRRFQISIRSYIARKKLVKYQTVWPISEGACKKPYDEFKWPGNKQFALILTHDVDTSIGQDSCLNVLKLEKELGFQSSFNFVPERYGVSSKVRQKIEDENFEVGIHGLKHDGKLYIHEMEFKNRANRINAYIKKWGVVGFRSPSMHHNLEWIHELDIEYDASTFDTDPFEPQPDGVNTIFPFWVCNGSNQSGYVELPYTLPQDFTLFTLLREKDIDIWKLKLDWIASNGGMALLNTHPDYMDFENDKVKYYQYSAELYKRFLFYVKDKYEAAYWHVLPREMASFWKKKVVRYTK
jgi:hypothetical protein